MGALDWTKLASRLNEIRAAMIHHEQASLYGDEFEAEALRRLFGFQPANPPDSPHIPYETVSPSTGLTTIAQADHNRDSHTVIDRLNREAAERERDAARAETRRVMTEARRDIAEALRNWCNERTVPSRFRREGVLLAASRIDPKAVA